MSDCLFCRMIRGEIPCSRIHEDEHTLAFRDINPQAPAHILVVPKKHYAAVHEVEPNGMDLMSDLFTAVSAVIHEQDLAANGYRLVINYGEKGGQTVPHIHVHILSGRAMTWPPG